MSKIGFIGSGNMAEALIRGILSAKMHVPHDVLVSDVRPDRLEQLRAEYGVTCAAGNVALVSQVDVLVLSVKPQTFEQVLAEIRPAVRKDALVISIAAGVTTSRIAAALGDVPIIRVMPNTPALIGQGASALYSTNASPQAMQTARSLFAAVGEVVELAEEALMDAVTAVSGSGPAYFFLLMEAMIDAAASLGLSEAVARTLVQQTAKGAALLAESAAAKGETPADLRQRVTSPGGTTEAALKVFRRLDFAGTVDAALKAARDRSAELS
ncbi:MAG: pyrroline-5-carboxylate reductase [Phycisphaerae bacterium]|nr:pyrroline-5-carboxylate reductase [Phycisphaerae bacterium]